LPGRRPGKRFFDLKWNCKLGTACVEVRVLATLTTRDRRYSITHENVNVLKMLDIRMRLQVGGFIDMKPLSLFRKTACYALISIGNRKDCQVEECRACVVRVSECDLLEIRHLKVTYILHEPMIGSLYLPISIYGKYLKRSAYPSGWKHSSAVNPPSVHAVVRFFYTQPFQCFIHVISNYSLYSYFFSNF